MKKKGFTLIELLAVIVILAIISLIAVPIVINIINDAKIESQKRSIDLYAKAVENAVVDYQIKNNNLKDNITLSDLDSYIKYNGEKITCNKFALIDNKNVYLSDCYINGTKVDYSYGKGYKTYKIGDKIDIRKPVEYNNNPQWAWYGSDFYVIEDSDETKNYVTLLGSTFAAYMVDKYGTGHINMYIKSSSKYYRTAKDYNSGGLIAYYTSPECGYPDGSDELITTNCKTDYDSSEIKYIIDNWANDFFQNNELVEVNGYKARLITKEELQNNLKLTNNSCPYSFVCNVNVDYWTMTQDDREEYKNYMWCKHGWYNNYGDFIINSVYSTGYNTIRPVINIKKSAIEVQN